MKDLRGLRLGIRSAERTSHGRVIARHDSSFAAEVPAGEGGSADVSLGVTVSLAPYEGLRLTVRIGGTGKDPVAVRRECAKIVFRELDAFMAEADLPWTLKDVVQRGLRSPAR